MIRIALFALTSGMSLYIIWVPLPVRPWLGDLEGINGISYENFVGQPKPSLRRPKFIDTKYRGIQY